MVYISFSVNYLFLSIFLLACYSLLIRKSIYFDKKQLRTVNLEGPEKALLPARGGLPSARGTSGTPPLCKATWERGGDVSASGSFLIFVLCKRCLSCPEPHRSCTRFSPFPLSLPVKSSIKSFLGLQVTHSFRT